MSEEEEEPQGSGCAGAAVITAVVLAALGTAWAVTPNAFVLGVWGIGWGSVIWVAKKTPKSVGDAANPAPPAPSERGCEKEPQVNMVRDTEHPNRWIVARPSAWMTQEIDKRDGT